MREVVLKERKSIGEKLKFNVVTVSHCLSCWDSHFLEGYAMYTFFLQLFFSVINEPLLLMILLLGSLINNSFCN